MISEAYSHFECQQQPIYFQSKYDTVIFFLVHLWTRHLTFSSILCIILLHRKLYAVHTLTKLLVTLFYNNTLQKDWKEQHSMDCIFQKCSPPALYDTTHNSVPVSHTRTDEMRTMSTNSHWQAVLVLSCIGGMIRKPVHVASRWNTTQSYAYNYTTTNCTVPSFYKANKGIPTT